MLILTVLWLVVLYSALGVVFFINSLTEKPDGEWVGAPPLASLFWPVSLCLVLARRVGHRGTRA